MFNNKKKQIADLQSKLLSKEEEIGQLKDSISKMNAETAENVQLVREIEDLTKRLNDLKKSSDCTRLKEAVNEALEILNAVNPNVRLNAVRDAKNVLESALKS